VKKPAHQWETRTHLAYRSADKPKGAFASDSRAEGFELRFHDGRTGHARLGLARQELDATALSCPDVIHAVQCWLVARGQRFVHLFETEGAERPRLVAEGAFDVSELSNARPATPPARLITLCPSNAELVHALGCFDRVIACEDSSDFPPEVQSLERLGPDLGPNLDRIRELAPDLVLSSLSVPGMERIVTGLRARGVPQCVLAPRRIADVLDQLVELGETLGVPARGWEARRRMEAEIDALSTRRPEVPVRIYLEWWPKPMFTPGESCYSNELIELAGGVNVFGERPGSSLEITPEELIEAEPELCFVSWCGVRADKLDPNNLIQRPGLENLAAAQRGDVFPLDEAFSGRPGPRMLEAARIMASAVATKR
jgi:iron complex transport system substrate-binding protein